MTACAAGKLAVVPAKAGTHNHRWLWLDTLLPRVANTFRITGTEGMGPRLRGDDGERVVRITFSFLQASVIAARKFLHVSGRFRGLPPTKGREAERRKARLL
jgi:hypothetical protein